jgi:hypothetical protein
MMHATIPTPPSSAPANPLWAKVEKGTLEACLLRVEGRDDEAKRLLQEQMPAWIKAWSSQCGLPRAAAQDQLRQMFAKTEAFVARGVAQRRLITAELLARSAPLPRKNTRIAAPDSAPLGLNQQVALGDITGMLDGLAEAEREARREALWPLRSPATFAAASF